jgi:putative colanic acid biosynthesis glycosyltransferase
MKIQIITICWNDLAGLKRTYQSINNQTYKNYSWIVIDGDSQDGTKEWLNNCKFENLEFFCSEKDNGIYDAMNKGISKISDVRSFVVFLNAGDELYNSDTLGIVSKELSENISILYGGANYIDNEIVTYKFPRKPKQYLLGMPTSHQSMYFSSDLVIEFKYNDQFNLGGDYDLYCKVIKRSVQLSKKIVTIDKALCNFYMDGLSNSNRISALRENFRTRVDVCNVSRVTATFYYILHYLHTYGKKWTPKLFSILRKVSQ